MLDLLEQQELWDNTIIVYISDNGGSTPIYADNTPLRGSKYTLYEGGIRVPFLISWPGKIPGKTLSDSVISSMDIFPTLCGLSGTVIPAHLDGKDLSGTLKGDSPEDGHSILIWDTGRETAVREGDWKLKTASENSHAIQEMVELELGEFLYNLAEDTGETTDLSAEYPEVKERLKQAYLEWKAKLEETE